MCILKNAKRNLWHFVSALVSQVYGIRINLSIRSHECFEFLTVHRLVYLKLKIENVETSSTAAISNTLLLPLQNSLDTNNLIDTKMLMTTSSMVWYNHYQISNITHFVFIVCHKLTCVSYSFTIFVVDLVSIYGHVDGFGHFIRHHGSNERPTNFGGLRR